MSRIEKTPVIIDTDPGTDDTLAILHALASPELEVLGFVVTYGNTDLESSYNNILKIYAVLSKHLDTHPTDSQRFSIYLPEHERPFLARGPEGPLCGELHSAQYFHGRDGLGDITNRHPEITTNVHVSGAAHPFLRLSDKSGCDLSLDILCSRPPRTVTYIALGPLTNLALMLRKDPVTVCGRIGRVICMGGALDVPGNTSPVAEFNFFADPYAVHELLTPTYPSAGIPQERFLLVPLDLTCTHDLPFARYIASVDPHFSSSAARPSRAGDKPPLHHFTSAFLERAREVMLQFGKDAMELHDIAAVWCAAENPPVAEETEYIPVLGPGWRAVRRKFGVERTGEITRGMLVVDRRDEVAVYPSGAIRSTSSHIVATELALKNCVASAVADCASGPSNFMPARIQESFDVKPGTSVEGVACIVQSPGIDTLLTLMLSRIWGVEG